jgi:hypothetical protein
MRRTLYAVVALSVVLTGCRAKELAEKAAIARNLSKSGSTIDLMKQTAEDRYTPPADGKLSDNQVKMYLKVREHEKQIAQVAKEQLQQHSEAAKKAGDKSIAGMVEGFKGLGSLADFATADIRAAKDLGFNTQEYLWVKTKILQASSSAMADKMGEAINAQMDASYQQMKKSHDEAKDDATKKIYAESIANYEKARQEAAALKEQQDPSVAANRELISHYEDAMNALANEMEKYSDKPGEGKKAVQDFEKKLDETKHQAGKQ